MKIDIQPQRLETITEGNSNVTCSQCCSTYKIDLDYDKYKKEFTEIKCMCEKCGHAADDEEIQELLSLIPTEFI